ncbi:cardiolipin synthase [Niameybacter sp.]
MLIFLLILSLFINLSLIGYMIFIEHKNVMATWAWLMVLLFIPFLGFFAYLFFGQSMKKRRMFNQKEESDRYMHLLHKEIHKDSCSYCNNKSCSSCYDYKLLHFLLVGHESVYTCDNQITLFVDGKNKFDTLFEDIAHAKKYVHLEYYIIHDDALGRHFKDLLIQKAKEGVEVSLLYDGMGCIKTPIHYFKELILGGVHLTCFSPPFTPWPNLHFNYRNHRKLCTIDDTLSYIGGFNIGDEYLGKSKKMGYWRDTHIKIVGSSTLLCNLQFLLDWRFATKNTHYLDTYDLPQLSPLCHATGAVIQLVASGPDSKLPAIRNGYIQMINEAHTSIWIQTPYFVPDDALLTALKLASLSGIDVRIMIPNKPDHMCVYWATYSYIGELLACGAKAYTYEKGFLHSKTIVIDENLSSVGTANFDMRSLNLNFEMNAFIYDKSFAKSLSEAFCKDLLDCHPLTLETYLNRSHKIIFKESISRLFSPIL